ncbi:glycoside hydrolase family 6 protein [Nocardioides dilutus]
MLRRLLAALLVPVLLVLAPVQAGASDRGGDPRLERKPYVSKQSQAYVAAQRDHRFTPIGREPIAQWVSENWFPLRTVKKQVRAYARRANRANKTPVVAIYAIPARDCGGYSGGGLSHRDYKTWVSRVAAGLRGQHAMAILEPDALGHLGYCGGQGNRTGLLKYATKKLKQADVWVYIDAGHSSWIKPHTMAKRLIRSGVRHARGFSVNVASFVRSDLERRYASRILKALRKRGVGKKHYVMDTSRNGGGQTDGNNWCNPLDARLGRPPEVVAGRKLDAYLWVKAPGESDGTCNGGPYAGAWWPEYALRLMGLL